MHDTPKEYCSIRETARYTGIAECYIRKLAHNNELPGFYSGVKFNVNLPKFREMMESKSKESCNG